MSAAKVVIYTTQICPYCVAAKRLLRARNADFVEIGCDGRADLRTWLKGATGQHTVPQIFINGESVGGYSDAAELDKRGELAAMLATPPPPDAVELPT